MHLDEMWFRDRHVSTKFSKGGLHFALSYHLLPGIWIQSVVLSEGGNQEKPRARKSLGDDDQILGTMSRCENTKPGTNAMHSTSSPLSSRHTSA